MPALLPTQTEGPQRQTQRNEVAEVPTKTPPNAPTGGKAMPSMGWEVAVGDSRDAEHKDTTPTKRPPATLDRDTPSRGTREIQLRRNEQPAGETTQRIEKRVGDDMPSGWGESEQPAGGKETSSRGEEVGATATARTSTVHADKSQPIPCGAPPSNEEEESQAGDQPAKKATPPDEPSTSVQRRSPSAMQTPLTCHTEDIFCVIAWPTLSLLLQILWVAPRSCRVVQTHENVTLR